ncbi:TonB-dependent receptor [Aliidiomarina sedimenti]|uniref:TonB-dependent receptor n=1 Tax=Aliidiomarina sedimenti TaxID=1933879 RepID=A0ABY0BXN2_9GAMM|nr:TonB-dependent receptor [Aliidiomarina sedimenti]RUO28940.1 TonB-dependent receptor [Aliidiomarina sedimenti]
MFKNNSLSNSVRRVFFAGSALSIALPGMAVAQDTNTNAVADGTERIQVTGSRIIREGAVAPAPVTVISGDELLESGAMNIGEVLSRLPAMANTYTLANSGRFIGTAGASLLDLRGMGTSRTLVLVDGRRHVAGSASSAAVDTNTIPSTWIERVEIITGGASAVYGADAVTGVVNFILKRDIEGFDATVTKGRAENHGYNNERFTLSYGTNFADNRGNVAASLEYNAQDSLNAMDHHYANTSWATIGHQYMPDGPRPDSEATNPDFPDRYTVPNAGYYDMSEAGAFFVGDAGNPDNWYVFEDDGSFRKNTMGGLVDPGYSYCQEPCDYINLRQYSELQPQFERVGVNVKSNYEVNQDLTAFVEAKYVRTEGQNIGQPFFHYGYNPEAGPYRLARNNAFINDELRGMMDDAGQQYLNVNKFHNDLGRRVEDNTRETMRFVAAVEGHFTDDWSYDASLVWGRTDIERVNGANVIIENYENAIDAVYNDAGEIVCASGAEGCVPINIMGREGISEEAADYITTTSTGTAEVEQRVATFNVQNPYLYTLPAGYVGFAGGAEYREESAVTNEDAFAATGATFFNALGEVDGEFDVTEVYAELSIPLVADVFLVRDLLLDTAVRLADYSTVGNATSWKVGLDWSITDELRARFTASEALRAPNINELFSAQSQTFYSVDDPCKASELANVTAETAAQRRAACEALGVPEGFDDNYDSARLEGRSGGNPDLQPEESRSYTVGVVYQPDWLAGFSATLDYWEIDITDTISSLEAQRILTECLDAGSINNQYCARITREQDGPNQGQITQIENLSLNIARSFNRGVDFEFGYDFDALEGRFRTALLGTYLVDAKSYPFQNEPDDYTDYAGVLGDADLQLRFTLDYSRDNWSVGTRTRFSNGVNLYNPTQLSQNPNPSNFMDYGSYAVTDLTGSYFFNNGVRLTLGLDNLFDRDMPRNSTGTTAGAAYYDNIGRFGYVRVGYSF